MRRRWRQLDAVYFTKLRMKRESPLLLDGVDCSLNCGSMFHWMVERQRHPTAHTLHSLQLIKLLSICSIAWRFRLEAVTMAPRDIVENINPVTMRRSFAIRI